MHNDLVMHAKLQQFSFNYKANQFVKNVIERRKSYCTRRRNIAYFWVFVVNAHTDSHRRSGMRMFLFRFVSLRTYIRVLPATSAFRLLGFIVALQCLLDTAGVAQVPKLDSLSESQFRL